MYTETKRVEYLDSIRGLAALFVLLSHTIGAFDWPPAYFAVTRLPFVSILFNGKESVCMFFVLSGFVLSKPYVPSAGNSVPRKLFLPTFYLMRLTRIWLPWFFIFVASILAKKYLFAHPVTDPPVSKWLNAFWQGNMNVAEFFRQCAYLQHDASRQLLNQDWSLGVELKGSALIPLFLFLLPGKRIALLGVMAAGLAVFLGTGHYYVSFIIGVLLAWQADGITRWLGTRAWVSKALLLLAGLTLYQTYSLLPGWFQDTKLISKTGWIASSLGCALILMAVFGSRTLQRCLSHGPFVFLGKISYSVYLLQFIVILCLLPPLVHLLNGWGVTSRPDLFALALLASVAATIVGSAITYRLVEVPAINIGHRSTKALQGLLQK